MDILNNKRIDKAIPLQSLDRPLRVPGRLRLPDLKTIGI
jgi:hypothetical protein